MSQGRTRLPRAVRSTVLAVALLLAAAVAAPGAQAARTATITSTATSLGNAQAGGAQGLTRSLVVTNTSSAGETVAVTDVRVSGADPGDFVLVADTCAGAGPSSPLPAPPTTPRTCVVTLGFKPLTVGAKSATVTVETDAGTLVSGTSSGTGRDLDVSRSVLDFGRVPVGGASETRSVTITNRAAADYAPGTVTPSVQFEKVSDTCAGATLRTGDACTIEARFRPTSVGARTTAVLSVAQFGPAPVRLLGEGTAPLASLAPAAHDFGQRAAGSAVPTRPVVLRNTGNGDLSLGPTALGGPDADQFAVVADDCADRVVPAGATCRAEVEFRPSRAGWRTAELRFDAGQGAAPVVARLSGRVGATGTDSVLSGPFDVAAAPRARLLGDGEDGAGGAVASGACDVDDDGHDDLITGASTWSTRPADLSWEGAAYVTFGGPGLGGGDLARPSEARSIRLESATEKAQAGYSVACAGDVNGDGVDDLAIGAWAYQYPGRGTDGSRGTAWVVYGADDLRTQGPIDLSRLGDRGYQLTVPDGPEYDHVGFALDAVGDVDGDGRDDLALMGNTSTTLAQPTVTSTRGMVFVVAGRSATETVDLSDPGAIIAAISNGAPGTLDRTPAPTAAETGGQLSDVAGVGDVDGDGVPDIAIGAYTANVLGRSATGTAVVVSGASHGRVDLRERGSYLLAVAGSGVSSRLGISVAPAGDVNDDGVPDVLAGADHSSGGSDAAYVLFGRRQADPSLLDASALGERGYRVLGPTNANFAYAVDGAGDVDGDGTPDLLAGGFGLAGAAGSGTGGAWVVPGVEDPASLPANGSDPATTIAPANAQDTTRTLTLAAPGVSRLEGGQPGDRFGRSVARTGDVDGDGSRDLVVGADGANRLGRAGTGEATALLTRSVAPAATPDPPTPTPTPTPTQPGTAPVGPVATAPSATAPSAPGATAGPSTPTPVTGSTLLPAVPREALRLRTTRLRSAGRTLRVRVSNRRVVSTGLRLRIRTARPVKLGSRTRRLTVARSARLRLRAGETRSVRVRLTPEGRSVLRRRSSVGVVIEADPQAAGLPTSAADGRLARSAR